MNLFLRLLVLSSMFFVTKAQPPPQGFVFVVDSSPKPDNGVNSWPLMVNYVYSVMKEIHSLFTNGKRFALIRYSDDAYLQFGLNWYTDFATILLAVNGTAYKPGSGSDLASALDFARTQAGPTPQIRNSWLVMVVVTDNLPTSAYDDRLRTAVDKAKVSGFQIIMVGVGNNASVDQNLLLKISSKIYRNNLVLTANDYTALENYNSVVTAAGLAASNTQLLGNPSTECYALYAEIVILIGSSTAPRFTSIRSLASSIAINFAYVSSNLVRFALVEYNTSPSVHFYLNWNVNFTSTTVNLIQSVSYSGGEPSNLSLALDLVRTDVFSGDVVRPGVPKIAIIITDDLLVSDNRTLLAAVNDLKDANVRVVAIGVNMTGRIDPQLLEELGRYSDTFNNSIFVSDDSQFANILPTVMNNVCSLASSTDNSTNSASSSRSSRKASEAAILQQNPLLITIVVIVVVITVILILIGTLVICLTVYIVRVPENASPASTTIQQTSKPITGIDRRSISAHYEEGVDETYDDARDVGSEDPDYEAPNDIKGK